MENFVKYGQTLKSLPLTTKAEAMTDHQQPSTSLCVVSCRLPVDNNNTRRLRLSSKLVVSHSLFSNHLNVIIDHGGRSHTRLAANELDHVLLK